LSYEEAVDYTEQIFADLRDRADLGEALEMVCPEIQEEIRERWIKILMEG
jgi:hypothetical protein